MGARRPVAIRFLAAVDAFSIHALLSAVDQQIQAGAERLTLLIGTTGGSVLHGLSAYHYLRGLPVEIVTHGIGVVGSIGLPLFCAGSRRLTVPGGRFQFHSVHVTLARGERMDHRELAYRAAQAEMESEDIARVVSERTGRSHAEIRASMDAGRALGAEEAADWGLVHEVRPTLVEPGSLLVGIGPGAAAMARPAPAVP